MYKKYMQRCLELAKNGLGTTRPNPMVGCVIVCNDTIIGEGYTSPYVGNHAEVNAIASVKNKRLLEKSTLYVSLEPCNHHGKTPPCSDLIIKSKIPKVVIGVIDEHSIVAGKGVKYLKKNGCEVVVGVLERECKERNKRFFTFHTKKRPYIILKWAETQDGFIDMLRKKGAEKKPNWISNKYSQQLVHKWRSEEHAILVGTNTVIADNPKLSVRKWSGKNPIRLILDNSLRIPLDSHVLDGSVKTIVFTSSRTLFSNEKENVIIEYIDYAMDVPQQICDILYKNNIQSVLIEGGAQTLRGFINADLWDEARIFIGNKKFGEGLESPKIDDVLKSIEEIDSDILKILNPLN